MHDLIVVGAGTAGCVLAERLTSSGKLRVLLIESGGKPSSPFVGIPAGFAKLFRSKLDWALESEPQTAANGRRIFIPRGKMLGGSSNMNAQIHQWGHPADFDGWAAAGASGWGWSDVAPVLRAQEHWEAGSDNERGRAGVSMVSMNPSTHPLSKAFVESARAKVNCASSDYNGCAYEGSWLCQVTNKGGRRFSAYDAWLKPALTRPNLQVVTKAHVTRINFDGRRAAGVTVRRGSAEQTYTSAGGVVLAAGVFGSPQVLMLSGIGRGDSLQRLNITVLKELQEVGANLQDHPMVPLVFGTSRTDTLKNAESPANLFRYVAFKRGMLASNAVEAFAFSRTSASLQAPDIELIFAPFEWRNQGLEPPGIHAFSIGAAVVAPESRGHVTLKTADPMQPPAVDFRLLTDADGADERAMLSGIRLARSIAASPPLSADVSDEIAPGNGAGSDEELRSWVNTAIQTVYHPTSTCRMGSDAGAVVDPRLRVQGLDRLWVADASVMPTVPRGHPNAAVAMIAERAGQIISSEMSS